MPVDIWQTEKEQDPDSETLKSEDSEFQPQSV